MCHVCGFICYLCVELKLKISQCTHRCSALVVGLEEYSAHDWQATTSVQCAPVTWREWGLWPWLHGVEQLSDGRGSPWLVPMAAQSGPHSSTDWSSWQHRLGPMAAQIGPHGSSDWSHGSTYWSLWQHRLVTWQHRLVPVAVQIGPCGSTDWSPWQHRLVTMAVQIGPMAAQIGPHGSTEWSPWQHRSFPWQHRLRTVQCEMENLFPMEWGPWRCSCSFKSHVLCWEGLHPPSTVYCSTLGASRQEIHYGNQSRGYFNYGRPLWPPAVPRLAARPSQSNPRGSGPEVVKRERGHVTSQTWSLWGGGLQGPPA